MRRVSSSESRPITAPDIFPHSMSQLRCFLMMSVIICVCVCERERERDGFFWTTFLLTCLTFVAESSSIFCSSICSTYQTETSSLVGVASQQVGVALWVWFTYLLLQSLSSNNAW